MPNLPSYQITRSRTIPGVQLPHNILALSSITGHHCVISDTLLHKVTRSHKCSVFGIRLRAAYESVQIAVCTAKLLSDHPFDAMNSRNVNSTVIRLLPVQWLPLAVILFLSLGRNAPLKRTGYQINQVSMWHHIEMESIYFILTWTWHYLSSDQRLWIWVSLVLKRWDGKISCCLCW